MRPAQREDLYNHLRATLAKQIEQALAKNPAMTFPEFLTLFSEALAKNANEPASISMSVVVDTIADYYMKLAPHERVEAGEDG
jgi:hypothetical protein